MIRKRIWGGSYCRTACLKCERVVKTTIVANFTIILQRSLVPYIILERIFFFFVCFCVSVYLSLCMYVCICACVHVCRCLSPPSLFVMCHSLLYLLSQEVFRVTAYFL